MFGDESTSVFDLRASWRIAPIYLIGGRLNPSESPAASRNSAHGFGWGGLRDQHHGGRNSPGTR